MRKYLYGFSSFVLGFVILSVSFLRTSVAPAYGYSSPLPEVAPSPTPSSEVKYNLPYPGEVGPDSWLWYFKAARDKVQYSVTRDNLKKADLALLYSDKRLQSSLELFKDKKPDMGVSVLTKGEKYLEIASNKEAAARAKGMDTDDFLIKLATASLKHREMIEEEILPLAPEDLKPQIVKSLDYSKNTYKSCRDALAGRGKEAPKDPFNGQ